MSVFIRRTIRNNLMLVVLLLAVLIAAEVTEVSAAPYAGASAVTCPRILNVAEVVTTTRDYCFNSKSSDGSGYTATDVLNVTGIHMGPYHWVTLFYYTSCDSRGCSGPYQTQHYFYSTDVTFAFKAYYLYGITLAT